MSAKKCNYSSKYKTLVESKSREFAQNPGAFDEWVKSHFNNPDLAINQIRNGDEFISDHKIINRKLNESPQKIDSIKSLFSNNSIAYNKCIKNFLDNVIESSIYNEESGEWINAEAPSDIKGVNILNEKLFRYKIQLINDIRASIGGLEQIGLDPNDKNVDLLLTQYVYDTLAKFDKDVSDKQQSAYISYVILKNFNKLISEKTPFIEVKTQYENSLTHGLNMYNYNGPTVKHRVSWTKNEHVSAKDQYSDLAKLLLNYLSEVDENGHSIKNTAIGVDGFTNVMNKFKTALIYGDDQELSVHRKNLFEGKLNILDALNSYLNFVVGYNAKSYRANHSDIYTSQVRKLRGIIKNIFNSNLSTDVKEMFEGMFYKTVPLGYITYMAQNGKFGRINLKDSWVNSQVLFLEDTINGAVKQFRSNPRLWAKFKEKYGIVVNGNGINKIEFETESGSISGTITYGKKREKGYIDFQANASNLRFNNDVLKDMVSDLLGIYLPVSDYDEISNVINENGSLINDFKEIIAMTILGSEPNSGFDGIDLKKNTLRFNDLYLYKKLTNAANTFSIIFGTDIKNTVNNANGDSLPTNGLTSLIHNTPILAAYLTKLDRDEDYQNLFNKSFLAPQDIDTGYTEPGWLSPVSRQGVRIGRSVKKVSDLNLSELLELQITYDFLDPLLSGDKVIYLQNAQFADKERQWIVPFLLSGKNYNFKESITNTAYGDENAKNTLINTWYELRHSRYSAFESNLVSEYNKAFNRNFKSLKEIDKFLEEKQYSIDELIAIFRKNEKALRRVWLEKYDKSEQNNPEVRAKIDSDIKELFSEIGSEKALFIDETTATKIGKYARINETALHYVDVFSDLEKAKLRFKKSTAFFAKDIYKSKLKLNKYLNTVIKDNWNIKINNKNVFEGWKEKRGKYETGNLILFKVFDKGGNEVKINATNYDLITNPDYTVELNPILDAYLLSDIIFSNEFNFLNTGDVFGHKNSISDTDRENTEDNKFGSSVYYDSSEASRLVAMNKRAVIYGGAVHSFNHDLSDENGERNRGVNRRIKMAVINDPKAPVWNMMGGIKPGNMDDSQDVFDGAGLMSIYEAILEQESLKDAAVGVNEKTLLGWNHKYFGTQILLKWAVYAITNETRRISRNSRIKGERLFKKMHNQQFDKILNMYNIWNEAKSKDVYIQDYDSRRHFLIKGVETLQINGSDVYARVAVECDKNGDIIYDILSDGSSVERSFYLTNENKIVDFDHNYIKSHLNEFVYNTIYHLDQFFGGAFEESLINGKLKFTNDGNYKVTDIICKEHLKDYFISYAVNKSAIKSGAANINSSDVYYNDDELDTMEMSTEFGGLQMDAEHELDDSEVTEMSQMISALMEKGWSYDLVNRIYNDIGSVVLEALKNIKSAINDTPNNSEKLKIMFGKALIEAYSKGDRDTLGLAQSFLARAERMLREENINFKFPFSGATINGSFISTVSSLLTKKAIRRKYSGVQAVLNPGHDIIQVYDANATNYIGDSFADYLYEWKRSKAGALFQNTSISDLINNITVTNDLGDKQLNPFCEPINRSDFTFEDTIVVETDRVDASGKIILEPVVIDGYEKYNKYKTEYNGPIWLWKSRPRNLRCSDTRFTINGKVHSIYDSTAVRAANLTMKKNLSQNDKKLISNALLHGVYNYGYDVLSYKDESFVNKDGSPINNVKEVIDNGDLNELGEYIDIRRTLYNIIQKQMDDLNRGWFNDVILTSGNSIEAKNVHVNPAEIVLGKMFAKQFLLETGDDIGSILRNGVDFFFDRLSGNYELPNIDKKLYDAVLFTKSGEKILVKLNDKLEYNFDDFDVSTNPNISKVNGKAYFNEEELSSVDGKEFYQIQAGNQLYNVVVINDSERFRELINSQQVVQYKINYNDEESLELGYKLYDSFEFEDENGEFKQYDYTNLPEDYNDKLNVLAKSEEYQMNKRLKRQAELMFKSFELSLNFIGTRIPAQAMQSFQPMKVVGFTDDEVNNVYVNRHNFYLEGSDLDIDKTYMLGYQVNDSGIIDTGTKLANRFGIEKALQISLAKNRKFTEGESSLQVNESTIDDILRWNNVEELNKILDNGNTVIQFVGMPTRIEGNNTDEVNDEINRRIDKFNKKKKEFIDLLNLHESSYVSEIALKNRVMSQIWKVALNPRNQLNLHSPINMDTQKEAAKKSTLSKDESNINIDIPSAKPMMQEQNMVGKQCIGITAVAIKCFFAKSAYVNTILHALPTMTDQEIINALNSLTYTNPITNRLTILANVNFTDVIPLLKNRILISGDTPTKFESFKENGQLNLNNLLKYLQRVSNRVDAAMELSGLLSAATDNAKELILSKINATSKLIDIYTIGLQSGNTFNEISDMMTSPLLNAVIKLADNNILKTYQNRYDLERAIKFYLGQATLPGVSDKELRRIAKDANNGVDYKIEEIISRLNTDNTFIEKLLTQTYNDINNIKYDEYGNVVNKTNLNDLSAIADYLEECIDRNYTKQSLSEKYGDYYKKWKQDLENILLIFIPAAKEQEILGAMLKINQGLQTGAYEQYSIIYRIENFIKSRIGEDFDLMKFIHDNEYRIRMIQEYEKEKSTINILSVISSVPHFREMFNVLYDNNFILKTLSARYNLSMEYADEVNAKYKLNDSEFRQVGRYINDMFIMSYLTNLNKSIIIPQGVKYYVDDQIGTEALKPESVKLDSLYGLASFKSYMENYVIPTLKYRAKLNNKDNIYFNNSFINALSYSVVDNNEKTKSYYKLPLNMMTIDDSTETKETYENILSGFNDIAKTTFEDGWTIADLFFIYNAIVNKDSFGQKSMTRIFEDLVDSDNTNLVSGFYEFVSRIDDNINDKNEFNKSINVEDIRKYIEKNVPGTRIQSSLIWNDHEDFTFIMPSLISNFTANQPNVDPIVVNTGKYEFKLGNRDIIEEFSKQLMRKFTSNGNEGALELHTAQWFANNGYGEEEKAFIYNGKIFINIDRASIGTVLHEYTHLVLAAMKASNDERKRNLYYNLVGLARQHNDYKEIKSEYAEKIESRKIVGSDMDEEVFCKILERYFDNKIYANSREWDGYRILDSNTNLIIEAIGELFQSNIDNVNLMDLTASEPWAIIKKFGSAIVNLDYDEDISQSALDWRLKTKSIKERLLKEGKVEYVCN